MFTERLRRYSGLIKLITALVAFVIVVVSGGAYVNANLIQRETYARAKTLNFLEMMLRIGPQDETLRKDIYSHLLMFRDGGRLATPFGPAWDYPAVQSEFFLNSVNKAIGAYQAAEVNQDWAKFQEGYNEFDTAYGQMIQGRQRILVALQYASAGIMFFGFLGILALLFFRLGKADDEIMAVRAENEHILASTQEGVFLIDSNYIIGDQKSAIVNELFGNKLVVQGSFLDFIEGLIPEKDFIKVEKFLRLIFGGRAKPKLMSELNPLRNVELVADRRVGGPVRRILNFDFSRDEQSDSVEKLLVTVSDITSEFLLKEELETTQKIQDEKMGLLKGILHVDPEMLKQFISKGKSSYRHINDLLEQGSLNPDNNDELLDEISRIAHRLKGDAASLKLGLFESSLHRFEDTLEALREQNLIDGQSLLKLVVDLKNMIAELDLADSLTNQYSLQAISEPTKEAQASSGDADVESQSKSVAEIFSYKLQSLVDEVAERNGKKVNFSVSGAGHLNECPSIADNLTEIAIQLARNSVLHGIELPEERGRAGKPDFGKLQISFEQSQGQLAMQVLDDGQGLNYDLIKQRAVEQGLIDEAEAEGADQKRLMQLMFMHGFSSRSEVGKDAGRGVGLDAVKSLVNELNGRIKVGTAANKHASFTISVPTVTEVS